MGPEQTESSHAKTWIPNRPATVNYLEQLSIWLSEKNFEELDRIEWKVSNDMVRWGSVYEEMESDKESWLWEEPLALAVHKDYKKLRALVKKIDKIYKGLK